MTILAVRRRIWARTRQESLFPSTDQERRTRSRFTSEITMYLERLFVIALFLTARGTAAEPPRTEITKWQDGKDACISLTFDDSSINQFRIDIPLLNERGIAGHVLRRHRRYPGIEKPARIRRAADDGYHSRERSQYSYEPAESPGTDISAEPPANHSASARADATSVRSVWADRFARATTSNRDASWIRFRWRSFGRPAPRMLRRRTVLGRPALHDHVGRTAPPRRRRPRVRQPQCDPPVHARARRSQHRLRNREGQPRIFASSSAPSTPFPIEAPYGIDDPRVRPSSPRALPSLATGLPTIYGRDFAR